MNKRIKMILNDSVKKELILEMLKKLNGESYDDCKQILDAVNFFVRGNAFLDADMARDIVNSAIEE